MRTLRAWAMRVGSLFRKGRLERELADEMESHLEMHIADNVAAGMSPAEARRVALIKLGGTESVKETYRDRRGIPWLESVVKDVVYGARSLRRDRGFTAVAIATLVLGIGANTAIFSLVDAVMLRSLPAPNPQQLVFPQWTAKKDGWHGSSSSWGGCDVRDLAPAAGCSFTMPAFELFRSQARSLAGIAAFIGTDDVELQTADGVVRARDTLVSGDFFSTLAIAPAAGRLLDAKDDLPGAAPVAVLSYGWWQSRFGGDPGVVGRTLRLNGVPVTVAGVAPPEFFGVDPNSAPDMWLPLNSGLLPDWVKETRPTENAFLFLIGRLRPGASREQARAELEVLFRQALAADPAHGIHAADGPGIALASAQRGLEGLRMKYSRPLRVLMIVAGLVLLIACANIANLSLARATARRQEIAVRLAIGAGRARLVRQLLIESGLLAACGALAGLLISVFSGSALVAFINANSFQPVPLDVRQNVTVLGFTAGVTCLATMLFGLAPALAGTRVQVSPGLKSAAGGSGRTRIGRALVVIEVSMALLLVVGAGLFLRTLSNLLTVDPGFRKDHLLAVLARRSVTAAEGSQGEEAIAVRDRLAALPGVRSVSWARDVLLVGNRHSNDIEVDSRKDLGSIEVDRFDVGPGYFATMQVPIVSGRDVAAADSRGEPSLAWVNEEFVRRYFPGRNPIGESIHRGTAWRLQIAGVVGDVRSDTLRIPVRPSIYVPAQSGRSFMIRTAVDAVTLGPAVRKAIVEATPNLLVIDIRSQEQLVDRQLFSERLMARMVALFGGLALVLAGVGIYGLFAWTVARRTREIAIRVSVGATPRDILGMVLRDGVALAAIGGMAGLALAAWLARWLKEFLFEVQPLDPVTYAAAVIAVVAVAALACYLPARRAVRVEPLTALRSE